LRRPRLHPSATAAVGVLRRRGRDAAERGGGGADDAEGFVARQGPRPPGSVARETRIPQTRHHAPATQHGVNPVRAFGLQFALAAPAAVGDRAHPVVALVHAPAAGQYHLSGGRARSPRKGRPRIRGGVGMPAGAGGAGAQRRISLSRVPVSQTKLSCVTSRVSTATKGCASADPPAPLPPQVEAGTRHKPTASGSAGV
jgi:hypothetical protein